MLQALINGHVASRDGFLDGHAVLVEDGWIAGIVADIKANPRRYVNVRIF